MRHSCGGGRLFLAVSASYAICSPQIFRYTMIDNWVVHQHKSTPENLKVMSRYR